jgi:hypothetical protein
MHVYIHIYIYTIDTRMFPGPVSVGPGLDSLSMTLSIQEFSNIFRAREERLLLFPGEHDGEWHAVATGKALQQPKS